MLEERSRLSQMCRTSRRGTGVGIVVTTSGSPRWNPISVGASLA